MLRSKRDSACKSRDLHAIARVRIVSETMAANTNDATGELGKDYQVIANLLNVLSNEVKSMTTSVNTLVSTMQSHDALSTVWESLDTPSPGSNEPTSPVAPRESYDNVNQQDDESLIIGDEADNPDDPLVLL